MAVPRRIRCYFCVWLFFISGTLSLQSQSSIIPSIHSDVRLSSVVHLVPNASAATNKDAMVVSTSDALPNKESTRIWTTRSPGTTNIWTTVSPGSTKLWTSRAPGSTKLWTSRAPGSTKLWTPPSPGTTKIRTSRVPGTTGLWTTRSQGTKLWTITRAQETTRLGTSGPDSPKTEGHRTTKLPGTDSTDQHWSTTYSETGNIMNTTGNNTMVLLNETKELNYQYAPQNAPLQEVLDLEPENGEMKQHPGGAIVGVVAGLLVAVIIVAVVFVNVIDKKRKIESEDRERFFTEMI